MAWDKYNWMINFDQIQSVQKTAASQAEDNNSHHVTLQAKS